MTDCTFSVVATNSIGSGEAGVVMITTPPGMYIRTLGMGSILIYMILGECMALWGEPSVVIGCICAIQ